MAADLTQNFLGKHFEKLIVAVAAAVFVVAAIVFVFSTSHDNLRKNVDDAVLNLTKPKDTPVTYLSGAGRNLDEELKTLGLTDDQRKKVMDLDSITAAKLKDAGLSEDKIRGILLLKVMPPTEQAKLGLNQPPMTVTQFGRLLNEMPGEWDSRRDWTEKHLAEKVEPPTREVFTSPRVVTVTNLQVVTGRGTTDEPAPAANITFRYDKYSDIVWNGITGIVDLTEQQEAYKASMPKSPMAYQPIMISRVELQRRELKSDGTWSPWQQIVPAITGTANAKWPKTPTNPRDTRSVMQWGAEIAGMQSLIRHMPLYHLVAVDEEGRLIEAAAGPSTGAEQPDLTPPKPAEPAAPVTTSPTSPAEPVSTAGSDMNPWATVPTKGKPPTGAPNVPPPPRDNARRVTTNVWAYDCNVQPGKTYQYQMRIWIRSPIYNQGEADPEIRWLPEFAGNWSAPSREVAPPPTVYFYFVGTFSEKANIDVQRWVMGQWIHVPSLPTSVGAPIVSTTPKRQKLLLPGGKGGYTKDNVEIDMNPENIVLVDILRNFLYQPEGGGLRPTRTNILIFSDARGELQQKIEYEDKTTAATDWKRREGNVGVVTPPTTPTRGAVTPMPPKSTPK
jgi:hypothetical protein